MYFVSPDTGGQEFRFLFLSWHQCTKIKIFFITFKEGEFSK